MLVFNVTQKRAPINYHRTVIRFISISAKFGICTVVGLNMT
jgi:hypothetical protein